MHVLMCHSKNTNKQSRINCANKMSAFNELGTRNVLTFHSGCVKDKILWFYFVYRAHFKLSSAFYMSSIKKNLENMYGSNGFYTGMGFRFDVLNLSNK